MCQVYPFRYSIQHSAIRSKYVTANYYLYLLCYCVITGTTLRKLPLDNFTLTEILRLHILASGAQGNMANAKFRYQQRGGYMPIDDAGLDFKKREPDIVNKLAVENIYDLPPSK